MNNQHTTMPHRRRTLHRLVLATALLAPTCSLMAQEDLLVLSTTNASDGPGTSSVPATDVRRERTGTRASHELQAVNELLIVGSTDQGGTYAVEIRDEQGLLVRHFTTSLSAGRRLLPFSVEGLVPGRYVASITGPRDRQVLRFRCD